MLRFPRLICAALLIVSGAANLHAENSPPAPGAVAAPAAASSLPPELQAELDALARSSWHPSMAARASLGWRDNVLLSPFAPIARAFARGEVEAIVIRPMRNRWELISFLNGDVLRYFRRRWKRGANNSGPSTPRAAGRHGTVRGCR